MPDILSCKLSTTIAATNPTPERTFVKVEAPLSSTSDSTVERVAWRIVVAAAADGLSGLVAAPGAPRGRVGALSGDSGWVAGLRETVAFGREAVCARGEAGAVGVAIPGSGAFAVFRAMVGAPIGAVDVASLIVGVPAVGVDSGLVGEPIGVSGLVAAVGDRGMVGAPVAVGGFGAAVAVGVRGVVAAPVGARGFGAAAAVGVRGVVGTPVAVIGLIGIPGAVPPGPAVLIGMVGAGIGAFAGTGGPPTGAVGGFGGEAIGAVGAAETGGRGALVMGIVGGGEVGVDASGTVAGGVSGGTTA